MERVFKALDEFSRVMRNFQVREVYAVGTGLVREAENREAFLEGVYEHAGIRVKPIRGEEEAWLTGKGVLHALDMGKNPFLIFDLGGGSTEFLLGMGENREAKSIPLGAMTLTRGYLKTDPPADEELAAASLHIDEGLRNAFSAVQDGLGSRSLIGTGGTVATLAAMLEGISPEDLDPQKVNGLSLEKMRIEALYGKMKSLSLEERVRLPGLDEGRADVILAGALVVIRILNFFGSLQLTACMSDLLEGILIDHLTGVGNERT